MKAVVVALLMAALAGFEAVADQEFSVGTAGAVLVLSDSWERNELSPDVGKDQFIHEDGTWLVVFEQRALLENREDLELLLDQVWLSVTALAEDAERQPAQFSEEEGVGHLICVALLRRSGFRLAYRLDLLGRDGLGYLLTTTAPASKSHLSVLHGAAASRGLRFPGPGTQWGRSARETEHRFESDGYVIGLRYRDSVYRPAVDPGDAVIALSSGAGEISFFGLIERGGETLEEILQLSVETMLEGVQGRQIARREEIRIDGRPALYLVETYDHQGERGTATVAVLELEPGVYLGLRALALGPPDRGSAQVAALLNSVFIESPEDLDAYPAAAPPAEEYYGIESFRRLLDAATPLGRIAPAEFKLSAALRSGERSFLLVGSGGGLLSLAGSGQPTVAIESGGDHELDSVSVGPDGEIVAVVDGGLRRLVDGDWADTGVDAELAAHAGRRGLLLLRVDRSPGIDGLEPSLPLWRSELVLRSGDGAERAIAELPGRRGLLLAVDPAGERALVLGMARQPLGRSDWPARGSLHQLELATGEWEEWGEWRELDGMAPAGEGWLVYGMPREDRPYGVYLLSGRRAPRLLLSGRDVVPLALEGEELLVTTAYVPVDDEPFEEGWHLYRLPSAWIEESGPANEPFHAALIQRLGSDALRSWRSTADAPGHPLQSEPELRRFLDLAGTLCRERTGVSFPTGWAEIDRLFDSLYRERELSEILGAEGLLLCAALLSRTLLDHGAEWVPSPGPGPPLLPLRDDVLPGTLYAYPVQPLAVAESTLFDEYGWWSPASTILTQAQGRLVLLGADRRALLERATSIEIVGFDRILERDRPGALVRFLTRHGTNEFLRNQVYAHLRAQGRFETLAEVSRAFAERPGALPSDRWFWYEARLAVGPDAEEARSLVQHLREAVTLFPDDPSVYLALGRAYERTDLEERGALAAACYRKVLLLTADTALVESATESLARIEEAEVSGEHGTRTP
jgi:hypothetical protein